MPEIGSIDRVTGRGYDKGYKSLIRSERLADGIAMWSGGGAPLGLMQPGIPGAAAAVVDTERERGKHTPQEQSILRRDRRGELIDRKVPVEIILSEAALRQTVGTPEVRGATLRHAREIAEGRVGSFSLRVVPFEKPLPILANKLTVHSRERNGDLEPTFAYYEAPTSAMESGAFAAHTDPEEVALAARRMDAAREAALSTDHTVDLITQIEREQA